MQLACSVWHWQAHQGSQVEVSSRQISAVHKEELEAAQHELTCGSELPVSRVMQQSTFTHASKLAYARPCAKYWGYRGE